MFKKNQQVEMKNLIFIITTSCFFGWKLTFIGIDKKDTKETPNPVNQRRKHAYKNTTLKGIELNQEQTLIYQIKI